jgi:hypothetical protein
LVASLVISQTPILGLLFDGLILAANPNRHLRLFFCFPGFNLAPSNSWTLASAPAHPPL